MALVYAGIGFELREVSLRDKPPEMLAASAKGTVPVLVLPGGQVLDESLQIMHWALACSDPDHWHDAADHEASELLVKDNDGPFKHWLDRYKYADRHPEHSEAWYRDQALPCLQRLNGMLERSDWLLGRHMKLVDVALFPFIRQFAMVDRDWFDQSGLDALRRWLDRLLSHELFKCVMQKQPPKHPL